MPAPDAPTRIPRTLADRITAAFRAGEDAVGALTGAQPRDGRDRLRTLQVIHDLHVGSLDRVGDAVRFQHHPAVAELKGRLEAEVLAELDGMVDPTPDDVDAVAELRAIARQDQVPEVYRWLADDASWDELVEFLALEGGPDAGFDDLVAACQIGLDGTAKLELGQNYWDEMGNGDLAAVHTELHHRLVAALDLRGVPRSQQPIEALERSVLGSLLATNRQLQPEMIGALGLIELQAGPRCRKVVKGLRRVGAPDDAFPFYDEHAVADPRHGKDWVDHVVATLGEDPTWADGIIRGARWRSLINERFFGAMADRFAPARAAERQAS